MVIDTSALVAILQNEPDRRRVNLAIEAAASWGLSVATYIEVSILAESRFGAEGVRDLDLFLERGKIRVVEVVEQDRIAREAFVRFGKGRHPAGLNCGDCFSYALAMRLDEPLLFEGQDFSKTDIASFEPSSPS